MATAIAFIVWVLLIACPPSYDCRAIVRLPARVVMRSGLDRVRLLPRLLRIPCGFVSFPYIAPSRCPVPSHPSRPPARFALIAPLIAPCFLSPVIRGMPSAVFRPYRLSPITPRPSCRVSGADFLNASNSMPLKMGPWSGSFLAACLPSYGSPAATSAHLIISSRCASLSMLIVLIQSHHWADLRTEPPPHHSPPIAPPIM